MTITDQRLERIAREAIAEALREACTDTIDQGEILYDALGGWDGDGDWYELLGRFDAALDRARTEILARTANVHQLDEEALLSEVERLRFGLAEAQQTIRAKTADVEHAMRNARAAIEKRKYADERQAAITAERDEAQRRLNDALLWVPSHFQVALRDQWEARERAGTPSSSVPHGRTNHGHPCCRDARLGHLSVRVAKRGGAA